MNSLFKILTLTLCAATAFGQGIITSEAAVRAALQNHPTARAAAFEVQSRRYAEKGAFNLPNPEVTAESPTGEFYTVGVSQSFALPTVYNRQKQLVRAETDLATAGQQLSQNELRYQVRLLYLEAQVAEYQAAQWTKRDSIYQLILISAGRQSAAGEIDFLQKTLVENEAANIHQNRLAADRNAQMLRAQLVRFTGLQGVGQLSPLTVDSASLESLPNSPAVSSPAVAYEQQAAQVAERQVGLAKTRALPNFSLGYINQGERNSPLENRFNASISIPLWAGQYTAGIRSAQSERQAATARAEAQSLSIEQQLVRARTEAGTALAFVQYYEREALARSQTLITTARRMREAGQTDYVIFLRTLEAAFSIPRDYAAQVQALEAARVRILYLSGQ